MDFSRLQDYEGPRCEVCMMPVSPAPGQRQRFHGSCRRLRTKKGRKRFDKWMARAVKLPAFKRLRDQLDARPLPPEVLQ